MASVAGDGLGAGRVTLHSSWRGLIFSLIGATIVTAGGVFGVTLGGFRLVPTAFLVAGIGFLIVVLFDYPVATTFSSAGVRRRMVLRSQTIGWDRIERITRVRPGLAKGLRGMEHGGLAAVVGRRRYLLVDQPESPEEFDLVYRAAGERVEELGLTGRIRPNDGTNPTWIYRRAKWAPEDANRR